MTAFLPTIILRHRKENLKKCSLRGLEDRNDLLFYTYPQNMDFSLKNYVMLHLDEENGKELSQSDIDHGLFFLDSTWNYEKKMHDNLKQKHTLIYRSLPKNFITAYPRQQTACTDPERGLATIEAIYIAYTVFKKDTAGLLEHYHFGKDFLLKNKDAFSALKSL